MFERNKPTESKPIRQIEAVDKPSSYLPTRVAQGSARYCCARLIGPYVRHVPLFSTSLDVIENSEDASRQTTWPSPYQSASVSHET